MMPSTRRTVLALCAATPLISGCVDRWYESEDPVRVCEVSLQNRYPATLEAEIRILEDDTILIEKAEEIPPPEEGTVDGTETTIVDGFSVSDETLPAEPGHYSIQMRFSGGEWEEFRTSDANVETDHVSVLGSIETDNTNGERTPSFSIWYSADPEACNEQ